MSTILTPFLDDYDVIVYQGDCIEVMREMPEASVDAVVTDPPYGIGFMGKEWDVMDGDARSWANFGGPTGKRHTGGDGSSEAGGAMKAGLYDLTPTGMHRFQAFSEAWAREAYRVLKPGGHLLAFAVTRTYHRMAAGVEDAGFEIRDCIAWMYGSGFPKSLDVSKAIDKAAGADRKDVYEDKPGVDDNLAYGKGLGVRLIERRPSTKPARKWSGWGTALKPAFEPIVVARKPLIGTVAENVQTHGTGALNINACRIEANDGYEAAWDRPVSTNIGANGGGNYISNGSQHVVDISSNKPDGGRWPANVTLDETAASILDEQSGDRSSSPFKASTIGAQTDRQHVSFADLDYSGRGYSDNGGASRFFYTAKASRQDRNVGGLADNTHPTVKPTDLMRWLIRLVTPPSGIILDPFGGSGSTGLAARAENVRCILIEREPEYLQIIKDRLAQLSLFSVPEDAA